MAADDAASLGSWEMDTAEASEAEAEAEARGEDLVQPTVHNEFDGENHGRSRDADLVGNRPVHAHKHQHFYKKRWYHGKVEKHYHHHNHVNNHYHYYYNGLPISSSQLRSLANGSGEDGNQTDQSDGGNNRSSDSQGRAGNVWRSLTLQPSAVSTDLSSD